MQRNNINRDQRFTILLVRFAHVAREFYEYNLTTHRWALELIRLTRTKLVQWNIGHVNGDECT